MNQGGSMNRGKFKICVDRFFAGVFLLALGALFAPAVAPAQTISQTAKAGAAVVTLKVLPAESFTGPMAMMVRDGGAEPVLLKSSVDPNHHLVVFVSKSGKPVEDAAVVLLYRQVSPRMGAWTKLPVVRMHVAGKGLESTHYGNNLRLDAGRYEARVTVNGSGPAIFRFSLPR